MFLDEKHAILLESSLYETLKPEPISKLFGLRETANELCSSIILRLFQEVDVCIKPGICVKRFELIKKLSLLPLYDKFLNFFLFHLAQESIIILDEDRFIFTESSLPPVSFVLQKIFEIYPKFSPFFSFIDRCSREYSSVLSGSKQAVEVLFPHGDTNLLEGIYQSVSKIGTEEVYLNLAKDILVQSLLANDQLVNAIEVGGGQGIFTRVLLPSIDRWCNFYKFTDIGQALVHEAKRIFGKFKQIKFDVLDISKSPSSQGYKRSSFDYLFAFNVVHATEDVKESLTHCASLVKDGGWLFIVETVKHQPWIDMVYGLLDDWWCFKDKYRSYSPLLSIEKWEEVLSDIGFEKSFILPSQKYLIKDSDTCLIIIKK